MEVLMGKPEENIRNMEFYIENGGLPSGKRLHNELDRSTIFDGKTHYFYGHVQ
jgi:hypothetical protein